MAFSKKKKRKGPKNWKSQVPNMKERVIWKWKYKEGQRGT